MTVEVGSLDHLNQIISQVIGPSFLLGAVVSFISMLVLRVSEVIERIRDLNAIPDDDMARATLKADIPRQRRRIRLLNQSILMAIASGVTTTLLIVVAFSSALLGIQHVTGSAILFVVALCFFFASLALLAAEVVISVNEFDHY